MTNISLEPEGAWIEWSGGECPVDPDMRVEYRLDNPPAADTDYAKNLDWRADDPHLAIIAYRVVKP